GPRRVQPGRAGAATHADGRGPSRADPSSAGGAARHRARGPSEAARHPPPRGGSRPPRSRLPLAALPATALAVRPKRRGPPPRQPAVIQTQIILAIVGALVMLVVGTNLARAFRVVG